MGKSSTEAPDDRKEAGLNLVELLRVQAATGLLPPRHRDELELWRLYCGMLSPQDELKTLLRIRGDPAFADLAEQVRGQWREWLRRQPLSTWLKLQNQLLMRRFFQAREWTREQIEELIRSGGVGLSHMGGKLRKWREAKRQGDEFVGGLQDAFGFQDTPDELVLVIDEGERRIEFSKDSEGLRVTCTLGLAETTGEVPPAPVRLRLGCAESKPTRFESEGGVVKVRGFFSKKNLGEADMRDIKVTDLEIIPAE